MGITSIPSDSRTLFSTPKTVELLEVPPGKYWHFGLKRVLEMLLTNKYLENITEISLNFNIDGLPVSKSSKGQFWPILCSIKGINLPPLVLGIYYGHSKPNNVNEFLKPIVDELVYLTENGVLNANEEKILFNVKNFVCDAPAEFLKMHKRT